MDFLVLMTVLLPIPAGSVMGKPEGKLEDLVVGGRVILVLILNKCDRGHGLD
jgi:hypothetical protein